MTKNEETKARAERRANETPNQRESRIRATRQRRKEAARAADAHQEPWWSAMLG